MRSHRRSAILFAAHYITDELLSNCAAMRTACAGQYDVVILYDNFYDDFPQSARGSADVHLVNPEAIAALGYAAWPGMSPPEYGVPSGLRPGNTDFAVLDFFRARPEYDFYWRVEYDVRFTGAWNLFFDSCSTSRADLMGTTLMRRRDSAPWHWWSSLGAPDGALDAANAIRGFFPVCRLSNRACLLLDEKYRAGWHGHVECIVPTLLAQHGLPIEDIGGRGEFVPTGHEDRFYVNTPSDACLAPGTFVFRPALAHPGPDPNMLWHPVRDEIDQLQWLRASAERGSRVAQFRLGVMSAKGDGVPVDLPEAYFWHQLAAAAGHEPSVKWRDEVGRQLLPAQLAAVRQRLQQWERQHR